MQNLTLFINNHQGIPEHTANALDNYFIHGFEPGSFVTAMLTNDLIRAIGTADVVNKTRISEISNWLNQNAPMGSFGSKDTFNDWLADKDNRRTDLVEKLEKEYVWKTIAS